MSGIKGVWCKRYLVLKVSFFLRAWQKRRVLAFVHPPHRFLHVQRNGLGMRAQELLSLRKSCIRKPRNMPRFIKPSVVSPKLGHASPCRASTTTDLDRFGLRFWTSCAWSGPSSLQGTCTEFCRKQGQSHPRQFSNVSYLDWLRHLLHFLGSHFWEIPGHVNVQRYTVYML